MKNTYLIITSIAGQDHPVLKRLSVESLQHGVHFIVIGDTKSPKEFQIDGCDFYSIERQQNLSFRLAKILPYKHYSRKNLGYLLAISKGAEIIIETDDDNIPKKEFWNVRKKKITAHLLKNKGWVNIYKYFTEVNIWPRGFSLEHIHDKSPELEDPVFVNSPIQQGLADENPDVDAIYRLTSNLPVNFSKRRNVALGTDSICPFNSQNTTWFKEAFPLLYLPSLCSFRMTDIWRSFIAQQISWINNWAVLFHSSTVKQERNDHNIFSDFKDELSGYLNNSEIFLNLSKLTLKPGTGNINDNLIKCYKELVKMKLIDQEEMNILNAWIKDIEQIL